MAKTKATPADAPAPVDQPWTPGAMASALKAAAKRGDRVAALKRSGILNQQGKLSSRYKNWGRTASRTPEPNDSAAS